MAQADEAELLVKRVIARLKSVRESKQLSLRQLEGKCGVTNGGIHHIESGNRTPLFYNLIRIANALEISLGDVISEVESADKGKA
jgi:transcriptional regulator with XRE-family HTH domain